MSRLEVKGLAPSREVADGGVGTRTHEEGEGATSVLRLTCAQAVSDEAARTRLIEDITRLIHEPGMPEPMRRAGLTLIGWLARRRAHEAAHAIGIVEARESEQRLKAARAKSR